VAVLQADGRKPKMAARLMFHWLKHFLGIFITAEVKSILFSAAT
jgi:hypothetical protein